MASFPSPAWIAALDAAAAADPTIAERTADVSLVVEQSIPDAPDGPVVYQVIFDHGSVRVLPGTPQPATVRFTQDLETARAISSGEESAQHAFMSGRLQVGGDVRALLEHGPAIAALGDVFAAVHASEAVSEAAD